MWRQLGLAMVISLTLSLLAYRHGALSRSGGVAAWAVGTSIFGFGGWSWGVLLGLFFVTSSLLSRFKEAAKREMAAEKFDKGSRRDAGQVLANGGLAAVVTLLQGVYPTPVWWPFFIGLMATVNADTWATELGTLSKRPPRLVTTGQIVERGTSGAVSWGGTAASLAGALLIGGAAGLLIPALSLGIGLLIGGVGGLAGAFCDSLLGATVQAIYYSDHQQRETERRVDKAGYPTRHIRGWSWLNNDGVNALSSVVGGGVATAVWLTAALF